MDGYTANARLDPINRTGQSGEDSFSGNCGWSLPLVGLRGRAGLDLGLSLSYNSLVWTKVGPAIIFNSDNGFSPGFRLGFPVIQTKYSTSQAGGDAYMLVTPSGARVELRRVGSTNEYDSADSSYLRLNDNGSTLTLRTTDGTQLTYSPSILPVNGFRSGEYRCTQIKDRNGNYLTINYHPSFGYITTVVDTLLRTVTFNYDALANLTSITQTWNGVPHPWASFGYSSLTVNTKFCDPALGSCSSGTPNLSVCGPPNGGAINVLTQVTFADLSHYNFDYTTWGQVWRIKHYAADANHQLGYTSYDLPVDATDSQSDCPRFATRTDYAENWTAVNTVFTFDRGAGFGQMTTPDGTVTKETHEVSGYKKGLTTQIDTYSSDNLTTPKKTVTFSWTQDNTALSYPLNPRVTETNVYDDAGNRRRSTISYSSQTLPPNNTVCNLPGDVREYDSVGTTVLRKTHTDYVTTSTYLNQYIVGLPSASYVYDTDSQGATPVSKVTYAYDASGSQSSQGEPVQHDSNYGIGFLTRGNRTSVSRFDVTTLADPTPQSVTSTMTYNTAGDLLSTSDPLSHTVTINYSDSFSDNTNHNTLAYPTTVTDPDSYSSTTQYDYDLGAAKVTSDPKGASVTKTFDGAGRVTRLESNLVDSNNNHAYTRYEYPSNMTEVDTYTLQSAGSPPVEIYSAQFLDGAGRVISTRRSFPGSTGTYSGQKMIYDAMGRLAQQSNPTEINSNWTPVGDDTVWRYTQQTYDWKGRQRITTNTDNTQRTVTSGGCGCAGGEVVTTQDEVGRQQRMTYDVLGRLMKTEILNMDQNHTVYSTTSNTYNARDQITLIRQYLGTSTSTTYQDTVMTYDGHGRLSTRKLPIEDTSAYVPTYVYNTDDTIQKIWDARGASAGFTYNGRHLVTHINYFVPSNNNAPDAIEAVSPTPSVDISYDAAGNRSLMTDGLGYVSYQFDTWSRLTSETRYFSDIFTAYMIGYDYNLAGGLKKLTDPSGKTINYAFNSAGQVTGVTATGLDTTQLVSSMQYRAWGALKSATFGNNFYNLSMGYNSRLLMNHFAFTHSGNNQWGSGDFQYYSDGLISFASSLVDNKFDRSYGYDQAGRLSQALTGTEARGGTLTDGPYNQSYQYDVWNNMSYRANRFWDQFDYYIPTYVNNRDQAWTYDLAGNPRNTNFTMFHKYDVASRQTHAHDSYGFSVDQNFDGDGQPGKRVETQPPGFSSTIYYVRSTLLGGQVVSERHQEFNRNFSRSYVYVDGEQVGSYDATTGVTGFTLRNPVTGSGAGQEIDPFGGYLGFEAPDPNATYYGLHATDEVFLKDASPMDPGSGCTLDGVPFPCSLAAQLTNNGGTARAPLGSSYFAWGERGWERHTATATADDRFGYLPDGAIFGDNGYWHYPRSDYGGQLSQSTGSLPTGNLTLQNVLGLQPPIQRPSVSLQIPIWCEPDVIEAMKRAWARTVNGTSGNEAGFVLNGTPNNYTIVDTKSGYTKNEQQMTVYGDTFLLFHVHPNSSTRNPSTPENNARGDKKFGDTTVSDRYQGQQPPRTILFLVGHRTGLTMYDPRTKQLRNLRENLDWTNPCK